MLMGMGADRGIRGYCLGTGSETETRGLRSIGGEYERSRAASGSATMQARLLSVRRPKRDGAAG